MSVLVDTPIWSFAYRRARLRQDELLLVEALRRLIAQQEAMLVGPVRQEVLSGFNDARHFVELRAILRAFVDMEIKTPDYELAAEFHNACRRRGVQGSPTDMLLCAIAVRRNDAVFTTDADFRRYAKYTGVQLFELPS